MQAHDMFDKKVVFDGSLLEVFSRGVSTLRAEPRAITEVERKDKKGRLDVRLHYIGGYEDFSFAPEQHAQAQEVLSAIAAAGGQGST